MYILVTAFGRECANGDDLWIFARTLLNTTLNRRGEKRFGKQFFRFFCMSSQILIAPYIILQHDGTSAGYANTMCDILTISVKWFERRISLDLFPVNFFVFVWRVALKNVVYETLVEHEMDHFARIHDTANKSVKWGSFEEYPPVNATARSALCTSNWLLLWAPAVSL